ncbi:Rv1733c family protein [Streptomyces albogriseolus]|uniref:Rv1733c family protein n=1 Tax=Streptomyces albogriseolus TaxID=1887 RepID=UPI00345FC3DD
MRTRVLSRRRRGPLCRRSDVVEAWTAVAVAVLLCLTVPSAGVLTTRWAYEDARAAADQQRAERHRVRAEVLERPSRARPPSEAESGSERRRASRAAVRWADPDEGTRTALVRVPAHARPGDPVHVWLDSRGREVLPPVDDASVWQYGVGMGTLAGGSTAAVLLLAHRAVRGVALRRRLGEWERDWARTGPLWTHRGV